MPSSSAWLRTDDRATLADSCQIAMGGDFGESLREVDPEGAIGDEPGRLTNQVPEDDAPGGLYAGRLRPEVPGCAPFAGAPSWA